MPVQLSVLLALAASSWTDARRERALVAQARGSFAAEVRENRARIEKVMPYHRQLTAAIMTADSVGGVTSYAEWRRRAPFWSGFATPDVAATAWQTAIATGALAHMSYKDVAAVSNALSSSRPHCSRITTARSSNSVAWRARGDRGRRGPGLAPMLFS